MTEMKSVAEQFPLSEKHKRLIHHYANTKKVPFLSCFQEALIIEWKVNQKIQDLQKRENYFKKVLSKRLKNLGRDWWSRHKVELTTHNDENEESMDIDSLICIRSFNEIYYDQLVGHISHILAQTDSIANEIFMIRMREQLSWRQIRKEYFTTLYKNAFYDKVAAIETIISREICLA